ncbi:MAG: MarR family winged helix-turn-helix transcriptional regulator [Alphaproteobacteria bacterium]
MAKDFVDRFLSEWASNDPPRDYLRMEVPLRIMRIAAHFERNLAPVLKPFGLKTGQFQVLTALRRLHPRALTPKQLGEAAILTSGAITPVLDQLEAAGLVTRADDPGDRRGVLVSLTAKGKRMTDAALRARMDDVLRSVATLSSSESSRLAAGLRSVLAAIETVGGKA